MSKSANEQLDRMVRMQYEKLALELGYDCNDLIARFEKRYSIARSRKTNIKVFYSAELEAIEVFRQRLISEKEEKKNGKKLQSKKKADDAFGEVEDDEYDDEEEVFDTKSIELLKPRYEYYRSEGLHEDASKEMEHLFGCLIDFRKKNLPGLLESMTFIKDKAYRALIYELETLLDDAAAYEEIGEYPLVFANYVFKLNAAKSNSDLIDRAGIDVFKFVISMLRKLKRVLDWLNHPKAKHSSEHVVSVAGVMMDINEFADTLLQEMKTILTTFGLENL